MEPKHGRRGSAVILAASVKPALISINAAAGLRAIES